MINDGFIIFKGGSGYQQAPFFSGFWIFFGIFFSFWGFKDFFGIYFRIFPKLTKAKKDQYRRIFIEN